MAKSSNNNLPSINDFIKNSDNLPSIDDIIIRESLEELPSIQEFIQEEKVEKIVEEVKEPEAEKSGDITEILRLINDVREDIPEIPEIKYYDKELEKLCEIVDQIKSEIPIVPEIRYYDAEIESICEQIDDVKEYVTNSISRLPEVKYYDNQIEVLGEKLENVKNTISELPEVRYYENDIQSIREEIEKVKGIVKNEIPDFSWVDRTFKTIDDDFIKISDNINTLKDNLNFNLEKLSETVDIKRFESKVEIDGLDKNFNELNKNFQEAKDSIWNELRESSLKIWEYHKEFKDDDRKLKKQINGEYNSLKQNLEEQLKKINQESIQTDELLLKYFAELKEQVATFPEVKYYDDEIVEVKKQIGSVKVDIKELYNIVKIIKSSQKDLKEGLLNEPPNTNNLDSLTPLNQNFATLDDLQNHYRLFVNRIQQQLSTLGGGGETRLEFLDDIDRNTAKVDGQYLKYDAASDKWVGAAAGGGGAEPWTIDSIGISTTKSVGIGTTANSDFKLYVKGDAYFTGNVSVAGTVTYDDVTNVDSLGIVTARTDVRVGRNLSVSGITTLGSSNGIGTVTVGIGQTALYVDGDARVVGILSVGRASVVIDGNNNTITAGDITITGSSIAIGDNVTINTGASGINSAPNVLYVAKDGDDLKNGTSIDNAKLTIAEAVGIATTGTIIKILSGNYAENNPIEIPPFVSIVGHDLKTVTVTPNNATKDIFHVRKGCYISNITFTNHLAPSAAIGFPTSEIATNVGGGKWESPYIQNCTSNTTTGTGLRIDGAQAEGLKSIVCDSYTQYNQGGVGVAITNSGYAQLVSVFTICCDVGISCHKGAQCSLTNSNTSFGTYGLVANGTSDLQFTGIVTTSATVGQDTVVVAITTTSRPYDGQVVFFDRLYYSVETITITNGGSGYVTTPSVTISSPDGPNGQTATAFASLSGGSVESITIISGGNQYSSTPSITISAPDSGVTATADANITPLYYTINSSTPVTAGITTLTLDENLNNTLGIGLTAYFYQISRISASSHTFEYVGSGNNITTATPLTGGVPIQENEVVEISGAKVIYTSTDQSGNFRIGDGLQINQNTGTISGRSFTKSLFTEMTPFILALS
jgi:hypothetical protein